MWCQLLSKAGTVGPESFRAVPFPWFAIRFVPWPPNKKPLPVPTQCLLAKIIGHVPAPCDLTQRQIVKSFLKEIECPLMLKPISANWATLCLRSLSSTNFTLPSILIFAPPVKSTKASFLTTTCTPATTSVERQRHKAPKTMRVGFISSFSLSHCWRESYPTILIQRSSEN